MRRMAEPKAFSLSLRVFHPTMPALDIVRLIGLSPRISQSVGEARRAPNGHELPGVHHQTFVTFPLDPGGSGFDECLEANLQPPFPSDEHTTRVIETGGRIEFFVGVSGPSHCSIELPPALMTRLGAKGVAVWLNIYADGPSETDS